MFKVVIIACAILPFPRGEILKTNCYLVKDQWQSSVHGYLSKEKCLRRVDLITKSIRKNFDLLYLKKFYCKKTKELS